MKLNQLIALTMALLAVQIHAQEIDFAADVLPILSEKCFLCHGPDAEDDFVRLDSFESATADLGGYRAVDPDSPEDSTLLERIHSIDDPMPPEDAEKQLSVSERQTLDRWILSGGRYAQHWAYLVPVRDPDHDGSTPDQIDRIISSKLEERNIEFAPQADRATLARRVALTLTGLPPDPKLLDQYLADQSDIAYETLVDALLNSPSFGEHQARYWLDAVRYGDTHGLHLDNRRGIYPYRDWVVHSLNRNLPLNQFITWQLAGDLLPNPTLDQLVATGFVRMNPSTGEGGAIAEEFQAKNNFDRVETFGTVFLGMSLTCARCHNHKYDPVTPKEYYELLAFFNNTAEPALDGNSYTYGPTTRAPENQEDWLEWNRLESKRDELIRAASETIREPGLYSAIVEYASKRSEWSTTNWQISKPIRSDGVRPLVDSSDSKKKNWSSEKGLPGSLSGRSARNKLPSDGQAVWIRCAISVPTDQKLDVTFSGAPDSQVFVDNAESASITKTHLNRVAHGTLNLTKGDHALWAKINGSSDITEIQFRIENPWDSLADSKSWDKVAKRDQLRVLSDPDGPLSILTESRSAKSIADQIRTLESNFTTSLIASELPKPRETRLLRRGEYHLPVGDPLSPSVFGVLNSLSADAPRNRLGLAMWVTSPDNPLVARVLVNRMWQQVFGEALVRTPEEFGLQGEQPTHPQLLDWLATELHGSGWDFKHILRLMVTSRTYRQSSVRRPNVDDPENRLFARGPSFRLDAEVLRDTGLWMSDLLDPTMGGEGVKPYQPGGMWLAMAHPASNTKNYVPDSGNRLYRRSLYVYWKRTSPHPMMTLFDAPDREVSCVRRSRTSTALQSLALLNETQRVEMGRKLAERILRVSGSDSARVDWLFRMLVCRPATEVEKDACLDLLRGRRQRYESNPSDAEQLMSIGEATRDPSQPVIEQAAWTQVAMTVLASDLVILQY